MLATCFYDETCASKPVREILGPFSGVDSPTADERNVVPHSIAPSGSFTLKTNVIVLWWWVPEMRVANFFFFPMASGRETFAPQQISLTFPLQQYLCCGLTTLDDETYVSRLAFVVATSTADAHLGLYCTTINILVKPEEGRCDVSHATHVSSSVMQSQSGISCAAIAPATAPYSASVVYSNGASIWQVSVQEDSDRHASFQWHEAKLQRRGWAPFRGGGISEGAEDESIKCLAINGSASIVFAVLKSSALWAIHPSGDIDSMSIYDKGETIGEIVAMPLDFWAVVSTMPNRTFVIKVLAYDPRERNFAVQFAMHSPSMRSIPRTLSVNRASSLSLHVLWQEQVRSRGFTTAGAALLSVDPNAQCNRYYVHASSEGINEGNLFCVTGLDAVEAVVGVHGHSVLCKSTLSGRKVELSLVRTQQQDPAPCVVATMCSCVRQFPLCESQAADPFPCAREIIETVCPRPAAAGFSARIHHVMKQSLSILEEVPDGFAVCHAIVQAALRDPPNAARAYDFCVIESRAHNIFDGNDSHGITSADMRMCVEAALSDPAMISMDFFAALSRRYIYNSVCQEFLIRIYFLVVCFSGFVCSGSSYAVDPVLEEVSFAFSLLGAAYNTAFSLGPSIVMLAREPTNISSRCVEVLLHVRRGIPESTVVDVAAVAHQLSGIASDPMKHGLRSWADVWKHQFPVAHHFEIMCTLLKVRGYSSAAIMAAHSTICAALSQFPHETVKELFGCISDGIPKEDEVLRAEVASLVDEGHAVAMYRMSLLRLFISRTDSFRVESHVDDSVIVPVFTSELDCQLNLLAIFDDYPSTKQFLNSLFIDINVFLTRTACQRGDCQESIKFISQLLRISVPHNKELMAEAGQHFSSLLVSSVMATGDGMQLVDSVITHPEVVNFIAAELLSHVRDPRVRTDREAKRMSNTLVLYNFWMRHKAFALAPRVAFDVASAMRMTAKPTTETLKRALKLTSLAVGAIELIPDSLPPRHDASEEDPESKNPFGGPMPAALSSEASMWFAAHQSPATEPLSQADRDAVNRRHLQLYCEAKLLHLGTVSDTSSPEAVRDELLRMRQWRDALDLSIVFSFDLSPVFLWLTWDLLHSGTEDGWRTAIHEIVAHSKLENNHRYLKECVLLGLQNEKYETYQRVPQTLLSSLQKVDPSALLSIYLSLWERKGPTSPESGSPTKRQFNRRFVEGVLECACEVLKGSKTEHTNVFPDTAKQNIPELLSETVLERVTSVAQSIVAEAQSLPNRKLVYLSQRYLDLLGRR